MSSKITSVWQKILPSIINIAIVFLASSPIWFYDIDLWQKKLVVVSIFFLYNLIFLIFGKSRDIGMIIVGTKWEKDYPLINQIIYAIFYTASFSTILFWIWFPFDLLFVNLLVLQLPSVLLTGTTLHGLLAGGFRSIK